MNESSGLVLGIDIGGTNTPFGLVDGQGTLQFEDQLETRAEQPLPQLLDRLFQRLEDGLRHRPELGAPRAIGVGSPNANALTGWVESPPNICWGTVDLVGELRRRSDLPVFLTNDANAAALGEWTHGAGRGASDVLVITLGTGLGSGLIVGGELVHGASGHAGELGHICVEPDGRACNCGLRGCLETYVSAGGLLRTAAELGLDLDPWCRPGEEPSPRTLHQAAEAGDPRAAQVFELSGAMLARGLSTAIHILSPGRIVVCGGITRAGEWLLEPVRRQLPPLLLEPFRGTYSLLRGELDPDRAGVLGAAAWARRGLAGKALIGTGTGTGTGAARV